VVIRGELITDAKEMLEPDRGMRRRPVRGELTGDCVSSSDLKEGSISSPEVYEMEGLFRKRVMGLRVGVGEILSIKKKGKKKKGTGKHVCYLGRLLHSHRSSCGV
jgi:hypothetical protein